MTNDLNTLMPRIARWLLPYKYHWVLKPLIDKYGNPIDGSSLPYCCYPDCGCDGARLCMAEHGPNNAASMLNREKGTLHERS